jgi:hypothetical protein
MSTDASKAPTTNLSDLVKGMLDRPFEGGESHVNIQKP